MSMANTEFNEKAVQSAKKMNTTIVFEGIQISGDVKGSHNYYLAGELDGTLELSATFIIGKTGKFKGEVKAENVIIEGQCEGKVTASEKVEIYESGQFTGDILTPAVFISDKAYFEGKVSMAREGENKRVIDMNAAAAKQSK